MSKEQLNPFEPGSLDHVSPPPTRRSAMRSAVSLLLVGCGLLVGVLGLALVSNKYGNTDIYGLPVVALGGMLLGTGICSFFAKFRYSIFVGIAAGPASLILLFILYWVAIFATAFANS